MPSIASRSRELLLVAVSEPWPAFGYALGPIRVDNDALDGVGSGDRRDAGVLGEPF